MPVDPPGRAPPRRLSPALPLALLLAGATRPVAAEENRWNVHLQTGPVLTLKQPSTGTNMESYALPGFNVRLSFEWALHDRVGVEAGWGLNVLVHEVSKEIDPQQLVFLGGRFRPWWHSGGGFVLPRPEGRDARPLYFADLISDFWVDAHVGFATSVPSVDSLHNRSTGIRFLYDVGLGTRVAVTKPLQLGLFVRWQHEITTGSGVMQLVLGVTVDIGFTSIHPEPDEDGDGVPDSIDKCTATPKGVRVNRRGCEIKESETKTPKCGDSDLDGVCDGQDDCPDTPLGSNVDKHGCPVGGTKPTESPNE